MLSASFLVGRRVRWVSNGTGGPTGTIYSASDSEMSATIRWDNGSTTSIAYWRLWPSAGVVEYIDEPSTDSRRWYISHDWESAANKERDRLFRKLMGEE